MSSKAYYRSVSLFWTMVVPVVLFSLIYYAYQSPGWLGNYVQGVVGPFVDPVIRWAHRVI